ncbi:MAG: cysteine--tRNA ligase [Candidatus Levyibacteriota bacterium]|jgi:cysteinyl-tRNA synthetase
MKLYNTLSHQVEEFRPLNPPNVGMYACGPTVYDYQHIGHMRRYVGDDILIRVLKYDGFKVHHVMNITDVGHLVSDSDTGEDKMEKGAKKFGKSVWDIAKMFEQQFKDSCRELNIQLPKDLMHATDFIKEQIELIKKLEEKGFTYKTTDGIYFNTSKFPDYFKLSRQNPEELRAGARIEMGEKKNVSDFALWKFSPKDEKRQMEWESPWGMGFPGWHIECSAMSMKALGDTFDIHTGGIDHINIHHTNEIAQSEAATGKPFVNYWVHHSFLQVEGEKMSKSLGNFYTVQDIIEKGFDPMALRYLYLQTHYRQEMNFTFEALEAAQNALNRLRKEIADYEPGSTSFKDYEEQFKTAINDDLNMPKALSILWEVIRSDKSNSEKLATALKFDEVLGLSLKDSKSIVRKQEKMPVEVQKLLEERDVLRKEKKFSEADKIREKIIEMGYKVEDKN